MSEYSQRMRDLLRFLLRHPASVHTSVEVAEASEIPYSTVAAMVVRLASIGWVELFEGPIRARPFRLTEEGTDGARGVLDRDRRQPARVWTMRELKAAVERGEQPIGLYEAARRVIDATRRA